MKLLKNPIFIMVEFENNKIDSKDSDKVTKSLIKSNNLAICLNFLLFYLFQY